MEKRDERMSALEPRPRRKRLWGRLGGLSGVVVLAMLAWLVFYDAPAPDLADLALEPLVVADEDNAYLALLALGTELKAKPVVPDDALDDEAAANGRNAIQGDEAVDETEPLLGFAKETFMSEVRKSLYERLLDGDGWTPKRVERWGVELERVAARVRDVANMSLAQGSQPMSMREQLPAREFSLLFQHLRLAAWSQYYAGKGDEAVATLRAAWHSGAIVRDARGPIIDYLIGLSGMRTVEETFLKLTQKEGVGIALICDMLTTLAKDLGNEDGMSHSIKAEARLVFADIANHTSADAVQMPHGDFGITRFAARTRVFFPLVYKSKITSVEYAKRLRWRLDNLHLNGAELPNHDGSHLGCWTCDWEHYHTRINPFNLHGRMLLYYRDSLGDALMRSRLKAFTRTSLTKTFLALRAWQLERGELPDTLEALVPEYLAAVPVDYMDGGLVRYSRELGVVWSVGEKGLVVDSADQVIAKGEQVLWLR